MCPDAQFERIHVQQFAEGKIKKWEVFLQEKGQNRFALSQTGSGFVSLGNIWQGLCKTAGRSGLFCFGYRWRYHACRNNAGSRSGGLWQ